MSEFHGKPWYTYVRWLLQEDVAVLSLGPFGALVALFERQAEPLRRLLRGVGLRAARRVFAHQLQDAVARPELRRAAGVAAGYAVQAFGALASRVPEGAARGGGDGRGRRVSFGLYHTFVINFVEYDNDKYPYVYSQTQRGFHDLVREIERVGERAGHEGARLRHGLARVLAVALVLPRQPARGLRGSARFSLRPEEDARHHRPLRPTAAAQRVAGDAYTRVGDFYPLRPGVNLVLFVRRDLAPK